MYKPTDQEFELARAATQAPAPQTEEERRAQKKVAVRSMITALAYVVLLIGMWYGLATLLFPKDELTKEQRIAKYVTDNRPMLEQVIENTLDPTVWEGIQTTSEVQELLAQENVLLVSADEDGDVVFSIGSSEVAEGGWLYLVYAENGADAFVARTKPDYPGRGVTVTDMGDGFWLVELG